MEEKIVENKKEGSSFSRSLSLSYLLHLSHLSIYLVCLRSTTPLWFTDKKNNERKRMKTGEDMPETIKYY
jgi:hypothetical protein